MFCRNCGKAVDDRAVACPSCGVPPRGARKFCDRCGNPTEAAQILCVKCGASLAPASGGKNKVAAGILAILLGALGIHKFYLGCTGAGVIMLLSSTVGAFVTCGISPMIVSVIGIVEGVIYLTKDDAEFDAIYGRGQRSWF